MPPAAEQQIDDANNSLRAAFVAEARRYLGARWQHQGRSQMGVDCVGLLVLPAVALGLIGAEDDVRDYERAPQGERLSDLLHKHCYRLRDWRDAAMGDILAVRYEAQPQHVMIVTKPWNDLWGFHVIHAYGNAQMAGSVVEHRLDKHYLVSHRATIHAAFSIKGISPRHQIFNFDTMEPERRDLREAFGFYVI